MAKKKNEETEATADNNGDNNQDTSLSEEDLRAEAQRWKDAHGFAASQLAQIHYLALGEITPVKRGVVEDVEDVINGLGARVAEWEGAKVQHPGSAPSPKNRDLAVEAYTLFSKTHAEGIFPAWSELDPPTQKLWRDGYNHVANGG